MKLTAYQKRHLEALTTFRKKKPSAWDVMMVRPRSWLPFLLIAGLSFGVYLLDARWGMFMIGMTTGAVLRIISHARLAIKAWPITEEITDWAKVEALRHEEKT